MLTTVSGPISKILIVRLGALGDVVHAMPAQQQLHACLPDAEIHWLTENAFVPLVAALPGVSRVWAAGLSDWSFRSSPGRLARLVRDLRRLKLDVALDFQGLAKSAILARASGARLTIGFAAGQTRERIASFFYSIRVPSPEERLHVIELNLRLAEQLGCANGTSAQVPLRIPEAVRDQVTRRLTENEVERPVLINPGAGWVTKRWPAAQYAKLAERIQDELGIPVVLTYGPAEEPVIEEVRRCSKSRLRAFPTTLLELGALCRQARLIVAGDTGPLHLAVALGTPAVAIMGPSASWRNGSFESRDVVVKRNLPCSDCYKRTCGQFICMDIAVDEVFRAVVTRLGL